MRGYLYGPPPKQLVDRRGKRWRGKGRREKIVYLSCRDADAQWMDLEAISPDELLYLYVKFKSKNPTAAYGSLVFREILVEPARKDTSPTDIVLFGLDWHDLCQPIRAWEAWCVTDLVDMTLQGIEYRAPEGKYRAYLEEADVHETLRFAFQPKGCPVTEMIPMEEEIEEWQLNATHLKSESVFVAGTNQRIPDEDFAEVMLALDDKVGHRLPNLGWRVANVWRKTPKELHIQARKFNLKDASWLTERIKRRTLAEKRKYHRKK